MAQHPLVGQGLLIIEASRSHSDTPHSVGLLWTSDQPDAETSTWQHTTLTRDRHECPGEIRTQNPSKRAAADPLLRPRGHCDRRIWKILVLNNCRCSIFFVLIFNFLSLLTRQFMNYTYIYAIIAPFPASYILSNITFILSNLSLTSTAHTASLNQECYGNLFSELQSVCEQSTSASFGDNNNYHWTIVTSQRLCAMESRGRRLAQDPSRRSVDATGVSVGRRSRPVLQCATSLPGRKHRHGASGQWYSDRSKWLLQ
jgi:hypothetical protein